MISGYKNMKSEPQELTIMKKENTAFFLPIYSKIFKICALVLIALMVVIGVLFMLTSSLE